MYAKARSVRHGHRPRTIALGVFSGVLSTILLGLWLSGHLNDAYDAGLRYSENRLLASGFAVEHIDISGARHASEDEVRKALGVEPGELVFGVDLVAARARVKSLGWVREVSVTRLLPNRISVVITERTPYALWQYNQQFSIINVSGVAMQVTDPFAHLSLPLVVGKGAQLEAAKILAKFETQHELAIKVHSLIRVSERRWNIRFDSGSELYLPALGWEKTIDQIANSPDTLRLLDLPLVIVDARMAGQLAVRRKNQQAKQVPKLIS